MSFGGRGCRSVFRAIVAGFRLTGLHLGSLHVRPARLRAHLGGRSSGNSVLPVTRDTSLELPGRAARSRGRTSTGEFQSIHGILSGTFRSVQRIVCRDHRQITGDILRHFRHASDPGRYRLLFRHNKIARPPVPMPFLP